MQDFKNLKEYQLVKTEELPDVAGTGYYLRHIKTGARIAVISNKDDNKVFAIGFRTPPEDSTGVAHIIEHSVLCGSDKYPAKDPFVELAKGSLNTFLNAMTYPDKTLYPVASCNMQDFKNLMGVYMDAVLHPNIYKEEKIFRQEGWHYELDSKDGEIIYNGVVYNEMKGAFSNPDGILSRQSMNSIFPDTAYGVESGGDPINIPDLTYENFLKFHSRYYHPTNSYIYLYGDMDFEERLTWLDKEYLSKYEKIDIDSSLKLQKHFGKVIDKTYYYSVDSMDKDNQTYYAYNVLAGKSLDLKEGIALEVLDRILFSAPGAPVKQALIDAGIGEDYSAGYTPDVLQPFFTIYAKNAKVGMMDKFKQVLIDALKKVVKDGINKKSLQATINAQEFRYKEADFGGFPKGLLYGFNVLSTWLYDDDKVFTQLHGNKVYKELKDEINTNYFEELVTKYFVEADHGSYVELAPKLKLNEEVAKETKEKLAKYKASLSDKEIEELIQKTKDLKAYQSEESTKEDLEKIPLLSVEDIDKKAKPYNNIEVEGTPAKLIWHDIFTNGINYSQIFFDVSTVPFEDVPYLTLLTRTIGQVDTKKHSYRELIDEIDIHTGGYNSDVSRFPEYGSDSKFTPYLTINTKAITEKTKENLELLTEMLTESVFTDTKRIKEILLQIKSGLEAQFLHSGHAVALRRVGAYYNEGIAYADKSGNVAYYEFIKDLVNNYEERKDAFVKKLDSVCKQVFTKKHLIMGLTCKEDGKAEFMKYLPAFYDSLFDTPDSTEPLRIPLTLRNEAFKTPGQVQYVVRGGNYKEKGVEYKGSFAVLSNILSYGYLWGEIRVKGGAYGAGIVIDPYIGQVATYSYRDPNLRETNSVYEGLPEYVGNFDADKREMTKYIIGAIANIDFPLTPRTEGSRSFTAYLSKTPIEYVQKTRNEILSTTAEDIRKAKPVMEALLDKKAVCVVGNGAKIDSCSDMFMETRDILA
ncbi:MAG: insulinase family protein [Lachnospiraceae bacterium]|nr:insulinase family protein [Lachnospiraceae bacterium]